MKMVKNIAIVAFAASFTFASVGFHMGNNYAELDGNNTVTDSFGATFDLNGSTSVGYDSTLGMTMAFAVPNTGVSLRMSWKDAAHTGMGLGYTWWSGGSGLKTSLSTNYDMLTNAAGTDTDGNLSLVVGFGF